MKTYNIFVSHGWNNTKKYQQVIEWLNQAKEEGKLNFRIYSDPNDESVSEFEKTTISPKLEDLIASQIKSSSIVIVISDMYSDSQNWLDFEVDIAVAQKKHIIGLLPQDQEPIPPKLLDKAYIMAGWNPDFLLTAILKSGI